MAGSASRRESCLFFVVCQSPLLGPHKSYRGIRWTSLSSTVASRTQRVVSSLFWLPSSSFSETPSPHVSVWTIFLVFPLHFCHSAPVSDVPEGSQQLFVPFFFCYLCLLSVPSLCFSLSSLIYEPLHSSGLSAY